MSAVPTNVGSPDTKPLANLFLARALAVLALVSSADASKVPTFVGSSDIDFVRNFDCLLYSVPSACQKSRVYVRIFDVDLSSLLSQ